MLMEEQKLIEKHAKAAGVDVKVGWAKFAGGNVMNDALLSGSLHLASGGVGPLVTLWARTRGNLDVRAVAALNSMPLYLVTRNPDVKSIKDFTDKDRIALPAVKVSMQAVIAADGCREGVRRRPAEQARRADRDDGASRREAGAAVRPVGDHRAFRLAAVPVPGARAAGMRVVLTSYDVLGGPATFNVVWTTAKFRERESEALRGVRQGARRGDGEINRDKRAAAEAYLRISKDKDSSTTS